MLTVIGNSFSIADKEQLYLVLASIKNQSLESKQLNVQEELLLPMEAYTAYKINYGQSIQFDPNANFAENFCKYQISASFAHSISFETNDLLTFLVVSKSYTCHSLAYSVVYPSWWLTSGPDLLWHIHLWWDWEGCEGDNWVHRKWVRIEIICWWRFTFAMRRILQ